MHTKFARFTKKVVSLAQNAVVGQPEPAVQKGAGGYADWGIVAMHGLREYLDHPYRRLLDVLYEMPRIGRIVGLEPHKLPDFSTVCARMQQLQMSIWRNLLRLSAELHDAGDIQAIDATGLDRIAASHHYAKRTGYTFTAVKTTALDDCETSIILDIHCEMSKRGDASIGWQLLKRNISNVSALAADKGYDWDVFRHKLHAKGVKTAIKYREFHPIDVANNALIYYTSYAPRANVESVFFALRQALARNCVREPGSSSSVKSSGKAAVRNVELTLSPSNAWF